MLADRKAVNLRTVADRVGLAPCSVSAILNNTLASQAIPKATKERVFRAAAELNYRPNLWAQSLRTKRTRMVAAITPDIGQVAVARVVAGLQSRLHHRGYVLVLGCSGTAELTQACAQFQQRGIEGIIAIDAAVPLQMDLPVASIDLGYMNSAELTGTETSAWLSELGATAAETIIRQIEKETESRHIKVAAKIPSAYFDVLSGRLGAAVESRESA